MRVTRSPRILEVFFEEVGPYALEVIAQHLTQLDALGVGQVPRALEQTPARLLEHRLVAVLDQLACFASTDLVDGKIEFSDDVKAVQNVQRPRAMQFDHV